MFEEVTKRGGGKQAARRGAYVLGSAALLALLVFAVAVLSARRAVRVMEEPLVPVTIVRSAPPPPPPPPPGPKKSAARPKHEAATPKPRPRPQLVVQPNKVPEKLAPPPRPAEPPQQREEKGAPDAGGEGGAAGGAVGGEAGGVVGGVAGGRGQQPQPGAAAVEEGPAYVTGGYTKPAQARRNCVQDSIRIPRDLAGFVSSAPVVVQFAIRPDGTPIRFSLKTPVPDPRIEQAIWSAIQQCPWIPGKDARGVPVSIWVVMPFRFTGG